MIPQTLHADDRAVTPTIAVILMVAIAVLLVTVVGVLVGDVIDSNTREAQAQGDFDFEYEVESNQLNITYETGPSISTDELTVKGHHRDPFAKGDAGDTLESGDTVTLDGPRLNQSIRVVREDGGSSTVLATYTPDEDLEYQFTYRATKDDDNDVEQFRTAFDDYSDNGVMWRDQGRYVEAAQDGSPGTYTRTVELDDPSDSVVVLMNYQAVSYEDSGTKVYAVDANGDKIPIACDASGRIDGCGDRGYRYAFQGTYTVTSDAPIEEIHIKADLVNADGRWWDSSQWYYFHVATEDSR